MDDDRLAAADAAYAAGEWMVAAREYLAAAAGGVSGTAYAYHRAGNALLRLKRLEDACGVYERALGDPGYLDAGAVACNLGQARTALGQYDEAVKAFQAATENPDYATRYKAFQGLAGAYFEMGDIEEAAEAYRHAVLDTANPEPGKALNNLGLCFVALERPEDAVEAYRAAVDLEGYAGRGRAAANLGMAYAALGMHERAVASFDRAREEFGHEFSPAMEKAYRASMLSAGPTGSFERVQGWHPGDTGSMPSQVAALSEEFSEDDSRFFTITDAEMRTVDRDNRRRERHDRATRHPVWVTVLTWVAVVVAISGGVVAAYLNGVGYPTQKMTVNGLLDAYHSGGDYASYWVAAPATDVDKAMSAIPTEWASYAVGGTASSARTSNVQVTVTLVEGGVVTYEISLSREGVGWKVNGVSNSFSSLGSGT